MGWLYRWWPVWQSLAQLMNAGLGRLVPHRSRVRSFAQGIGLVILCGLLIVSCSRSHLGSRRLSSQPDRIVIGTISGIRTLDPADAYELWSGNLLYNLGDRLYTYEPGSNNLKPQLATDFPQITPDGLTYKIPLRQGVVFHDGTPFNAAAMVFSLRRFIENGGSPSFLLGDAIAAIQATGDYELTIQLKQPFVGFTKLLAFSGACAVSPNAYEIGEGKFKPNQFVGTGPYKLVSYGTDSLKLEAFDRYWGEKPKNQGIDLQRFSSSANLFIAFRTGAIDVAYQTLDADQVLYLQRHAQEQGWQVVIGSGTGIYYLTLNLQSPPLDRVEVRQALAAAIDRPLLQQRVFRGQVDPLYSLIPNSLEISQPLFRDLYGDGNLAKVTELLQKAGYSPAKPLVLELWYRSNLVTNQLAASTIKAAIDKYLEGWLKLELKGVESATMYTNLDKGAYPIAMLDWSADFLDSDSYLQPFVDCTQGTVAKGCESGASHLQGSFYYNNRVNQLIQQQRQEQQVDRRNQLLRELQRIIAQDVPFIPLWQNKQYLFAQKGIIGAQLNPMQQIPFRQLQADFAS